jgi:hypothetical protein
MHKIKLIAILLIMASKLVAQDIYQTEKVFIQTDRESYLKGDTIWMSASVYDATSLLPSIQSGIAHIVVYNEKNAPLAHLKVKLENGKGDAFYPIPKNQSGTKIQIKSYTNVMRNFEEKYFFVKDISLNSTPSAVATKNELSPKVLFFPEGGRIVENLTCKVALKALEFGKIPKTFEGKIVDSKGTMVTTFFFDTQGLSTMFLKPVSGEKYFAVYKLGDKEYKDELPAAEPYGFVLAVDNVVFQDGALVDVYSNLNETQKLTLIAQQRGEVLTRIPFETTSTLHRFNLDGKNIPFDGIVQIMIKDESGKTLNERLIYHRKSNPFKTKIINYKNSRVFKGGVSFDLEVTDNSGKAVSDADLNVAVEDIAYSKNGPDLSLEKYLKFDADLGEISVNTDSIKSLEPTISKFYLDNLMLTLKWPRKSGDQKFLSEKTLMLEGKVSLNGRSFGAGLCHLFFQDKVGWSSYVAETDGRGVFKVAGFWMDSVKIVATDAFGTQLDLKLAEEFVPGVAYDNSAFEKIEDETLSEADLKSNAIQLDEIVVKSTVDLKNDYRRKAYAWLPDAEFVPNAEELSKFDRSISLVEHFVGELNHPSTADSITKTKLKTAVYMDGKRVPQNFITLVKPSDIILIDKITNAAKIKKMGETSVSVVNILTKKDKNVNTVFKSPKTITWLGAAPTKEFYSPTYKVRVLNRPIDKRKTLHWATNLKTDADGKVKVSFSNSDTSKAYRVIVNGSDEVGHFFNLEQILR